MFVWQQAAGQRHARQAIHRGVLDLGATFKTLCGYRLEVGEADVHTPDKPWLDPTCEGCDYKIRRALGIPPAPRENAEPLVLEDYEDRQRPKVKC
ncbi:zinc finger protein [Amycolatopsis sp. NPDC051372]|uniref:zinc finger protein n=1 Tax=Amycolatopsis sp. NPDC051372 TaxID=3155669 RepID=UPI0034255CA9